MKELRDGTIKGFQSEKAHIVEKIAFKNKMRERQRQAKLVLINKEKEEIMKARKLLKKKKTNERVRESTTNERRCNERKIY